MNQKQPTRAEKLPKVNQYSFVTCVFCRKEVGKIKMLPNCVITTQGYCEHHAIKIGNEWIPTPAGNATLL